MKNYLSKSIFFVALLFSTLNIFAYTDEVSENGFESYDFTAVNEDGVLLYYKIVSETEKTCYVSMTWDRYDYIYDSPTDVVGDVVIPSSANGYKVTGIGYFAFSYCRNLRSVIIPNSVTYIGEEAFAECSGLEFVTIPNSVKYIHLNAFRNCESLVELIIPNSIVHIGQNAFRGCTNLSSITSFVTDVFETGEDAFNGCEDAILYVPKGLVNTYKAIADWNRLTKIEKIVEKIPMSLSCNTRGYVLINNKTEFSNNIGEVDVNGEGVDNTFVFTPNYGCKLEQVIIDSWDVTQSVKDNKLTTKIDENSKMIVTFSEQSSDINNDGKVDVSDVVTIVNLILGM